MVTALVAPPNPHLDDTEYSLQQILAIWAVVSLPMALLAWGIGPLVIPLVPLHPGITHWLLMIAGMI